MKKFCSALLCAAFLLAFAPLPARAAGPVGEFKVGAALLMEKETGRVLYEENCHAQLEPASVTKVMTLLLVMEAIDGGRLRLEDAVTASPHAVSMGGSQIWLKENETLTVGEMLKAVAVVSANDCAVALAEAVAGSEETFVSRMNDRARELGMADTHFVNCTGLPAEGHVTSAYDIALMSRELILKHPQIREYATIWMDTLRDGASQLVNTNKLIRTYPGATGLKTGSTDAALYCLAATAERDGMELIAVVMKAPTSADRFEAAQALLNYGFANYTLLDVWPREALTPVEVTLGTRDTVQPVAARSGRVLVEKDKADKVTTTLTLADRVEAPVEAGQILGRMTIQVDGVTVDEIPLTADRAVERLTVLGIFKALIRGLFLGG